ncbi:MAG: hypothetical protein H6907_12125 [Hyphomicrobiales bacterium]|nr:hypothetical protein [Hyphomicrobiales bacterium]MCP5372469.1 hypothetical protein [Hyphomicrobiales bacterium]
MSNRLRQAFSREAVGVFASADAMQAAIDELLSSGFDRAEINLLAGEHAVREKLGHLYTRTAEAEDDPAAPRTAYVSPESIGDAEGGVIGALMYLPASLAAGAVVASGGTLAAAAGATALALGAGALVGAALAGVIGDHHARFLHDQLEKGGLLLWVLTRTAERESRAAEILSRHGARDVHVHGLRSGRKEGEKP